ncbi:MAG: cob(I)yrinic acid a,c-diamide adenosyltransferase [Pseudoflavonifractor sp.]
MHIYCGDGKGKTTCAFGLALRACGRGKKVLVAQFLKSSDSGERDGLALLPGATLLPVPEQIKFTFAMDEAERRAAAADCVALLDRVAALAGGYDLILLDECCGAVNTGLLPVDRLTEFLDSRPAGAEVILTGRDPVPELVVRADYITEMKKIRHPYDKGVPARKGIEW